ncbi:MAG: HAD-IB family phosphatase [Spirochaetota bacterium]|jgi:HAD superfamily phosphoserine phosphatase-like hydrolase|nr:HAD-IB family phosphatase [Spirochaetota bacterium]
MAYSIPPAVRIVFFDMDNTLIANDCDVSWKIFLADKGLAGWRDRVLGRWHYFRYCIGRLNAESFTRFQFKQFIGKTAEEMRPLLDEHFRERVLPRIYPAVFPLLDELKVRKIPRILITSTNAEIARPLSEHLKMDALIATELERGPDGRFTGRAMGALCLGRQKLPAMEKAAGSLNDVMYWGDSAHDIPILASVGYPLAANPASKLRAEAKKRGWPIVDFTAPPRSKKANTFGHEKNRMKTRMKD